MDVRNLVEIVGAVVLCIAGGGLVVLDMAMRAHRESSKSISLYSVEL